MGLEVKDLEPISQGITDIKSKQEEVKQLATEAKTEAAEIKKDVSDVKTEIESVKKDTTELKTWKESKDKTDEKNQEALDKIILDRQRTPIADKQETKSFNDIIGEAIEKNADRLRDMRVGNNDFGIDLMPDVKADKKGQREIKTVGDMSIPANFTDATSLYRDVRGLIQSPYNRVWLADVLPNGTSNGTSIVYPKENGGEGGAALWTDPTADKAQMDFDLNSTTGYFKWIAGIVIVGREMLDDIPFMTSYLQNKMLISLKTAENAFILNGSSDTNPVDGLLDVATAYSGTYSSAIDRLMDAGYGQIVEDTNEFYQGTTAVIRPRDAVKIGLNKADGSGEYTLPPGTSAFANGRLSIGLDTVTTTGITANNFIVFDRGAVMFIRRMVPELRVFEDSTLAKKNKVMFRIEERVTLAIFNNSAIVTGTLATGS